MDKNKKLVGNINGGYAFMDADEVVRIETLGNIIGGYLGKRTTCENDIPYHTGPQRSGRYPWTQCIPKITKVIFSNPATIVYWEDGSKTIVKADNELFDPEKGLAMAITKKALGNKGNYFNEIKKWIGDHEDGFGNE